MEVKYRVYVSFAVLIVLIFGLYFFTDWFSKVTGYLSGEDSRTKLAQCLEGQGAQYYSGDICADCEKQVDIFGRAIKSISSVQCKTDYNGKIIDEKCSSLKEVPAWYINNTIYYGFKNMTELQSLSGCIDE